MHVIDLSHLGSRQRETARRRLVDLDRLAFTLVKIVPDARHPGQSVEMVICQEDCGRVANPHAIAEMQSILQAFPTLTRRDLPAFHQAIEAAIVRATASRPVRQSSAPRGGHPTTRRLRFPAHRPDHFPAA